jgi:hypothetical protein
MPKIVLRVTRTRGQNAAYHQQDLTRSRLQQFEQSECQAMWATLNAGAASTDGPETTSAKRARTEVDVASSAAVRRAQQSLAEGSPGKPLQQLTSPGLPRPTGPSSLGQAATASPTRSAPTARPGCPSRICHSPPLLHVGTWTHTRGNGTRILWRKPYPSSKEGRRCTLHSFGRGPAETRL